MFYEMYQTDKEHFDVNESKPPSRLTKMYTTWKRQLQTLESEVRSLQAFPAIISLLLTDSDGEERPKHGTNRTGQRFFFL